MSNAGSFRTPKYRQHKASGQAVVTVKGRDHYLGKYRSSASREAYKRIVAEYLQTGHVADADSQQSVTVAEVLAAYLRFAKTYYQKNGKATREYGLLLDCCRFVKPLYARSRAVEFGPLALKAVRQSMVDADHSRKHINKNVERICRMFRWAAAEELIPASVPQALSMVTGLRKGRTNARETKPVLPVDESAINVTLEHLPDVVADMVRFQRHTGCRPEEVCIIRPMDVDRSGDIWQYRPESHKTEHHGRERIVFVGPTAQGVLLRYLARDTATYCFRPCDSEQKRRAAAHQARKTPLSCGNVPGTNRSRKPQRPAGEQYTAGSYRRAIHRACDKAKMERWSPNRLRHTAATEIRKRFGLEAAQVALGHSQATVTQVYAERDYALAASVAKQIG